MVNPSDFQTAWEIVIAEHAPGGSGPGPRGKWCM
jgi:hypothetical protein